MSSISTSHTDDKTSSASRRARMRRLARIAEIVSLAALTLVAAYCLYLLVSPRELWNLLTQQAPGSIASATNAQFLAAIALWALPVALFLAALWQARAFFRVIRHDGMFSDAAPRLLGRLGMLAIAAAIAGTVSRTLIVLILTLSNPPGSRMLVIGAGTADIAALIVGLLFSVFALVMQEALQVERENRDFI